MASLPYLSSPGSIKTALEKIRQAATPDRVTGDFVSTKLNMKGGTGRAILPYLKKIGLVASDGAPSDLYKQFRNPQAAPAAIARAVKIGYQALQQANEYFYDLNDKDLLALIVQVTGAEANSAVAKYTLGTLKAVKSFANFEVSQTAEKAPAGVSEGNSAAVALPIASPVSHSEGIGLNLSYTINLNLPATPDQAVFNAIFRSLKENLLSNVK